MAEWTTDEFAYYDGGSEEIVVGREKFDAWLAAHDAEVAALAVVRGAK